MKVKENPLDNPTPAMYEVLKMRNTACNLNVGKRNRSDSTCSSPLVYEQSTLTPAMEEVIKRREVIKRAEGDTEDSTAVTALSARASRLRVRNESKVTKSKLQKPTCTVQLRRGTRKISAPEKKPQALKCGRKSPRKYSLPEKNKFTVDERSVSGIKSGKKEATRRMSQRIQKKTQNCKKGLPTMPKYVMKRKLDFNQKKRTRRREVSPSEINFVPRLRSGLDTSEDKKVLEMWANSTHAKKRIRHYAATGVNPKVNRVSSVVYSRPSLRRHRVSARERNIS